MTVVERGVLLSHGRKVLAENGEYLSFPNDWRRRIIYKTTKDEKKRLIILEILHQCQLHPPFFLRQN